MAPQADSKKPDQVHFAHLMGEVILALANHEQGDRRAVGKQLDGLRTSIDRDDTPEQQADRKLLSWAVQFAAEIAKR